MVVVESRLRIEDWVFDWFQQRGKPLPAWDAEKATVDYLESGLIDSVMMIDFIMDIESEFRIRLTSRMMADPRFSTISGLIDMIAEASAT